MVVGFSKCLSPLLTKLDALDCLSDSLGILNFFKGSREDILHGLEEPGAVDGKRFGTDTCGRGVGKPFDGS